MSGGCGSGRVLVAGWFSFPQMGATAGDLLAKDVVCQWLRDAGRAFDVALASPFPGGIAWNLVDASDYSDVVFVCGPFGNGWPIPEFLARFAGRRFHGLNLSMLQPLDEWNPFDTLLERDSSVTVRPELAFLSQDPSVPIVGLILVHDQLEYKKEGRHAEANFALTRLTGTEPMAVVEIDTRLDTNKTGLRTQAEVESLISRMDVVLTTRLHGLVLALKNGVPAVAVDPVAGGAKVLRQAQLLGWPAAFTTDVHGPRLTDAFAWALTQDARVLARHCRDRAVATLSGTREQFLAGLSKDAPAL